MTHTSSRPHNAGIPLHVEDACVVLGSHTILHSINLQVHSGQSLAILGANGSGKSTLMKACLGLLPLASGRVTLLGHEVSVRRSIPWQQVGYVPQRVTAASGVPATALEVVRTGLLGPRRLWADRGRKANAAALAALDAVGIADRAHDHVQVFSGGQAQRVMIARALVRQPSLLVLDEPLSGIDKESRESLAAILTDLRATGMTIMSVLHEMGELAAVMERAIVLSQGRIIADRHAHELSPAHHDHDHHDTLGHDTAQDCEHEHAHGDTSPAPHHAPVLSHLPTHHSQTKA